MYHFICPGCGHREISGERDESLLHRSRGCHRCGFGFVFDDARDPRQTTVDWGVRQPAG
jgi:hypothetical protein